jgi:hypothetical protein
LFTCPPARTVEYRATPFQANSDQARVAARYFVPDIFRREVHVALQQHWVAGFGQHHAVPGRRGHRGSPLALAIERCSFFMFSSIPAADRRPACILTVAGGRRSALRA